MGAALKVHFSGLTRGWQIDIGLRETVALLEK